MIPLIIVCVVFVVLSTIVLFTEEKTSAKIGSIFTVAFLLGIIYGLLMLIGNLWTRDNPKFKKYEYKEQTIQSLVNKPGLSVQGQFVLGCGGISGHDVDYYVAYAMFPDGLLRIRVDASNTFVRETNTETPTIVNYWERTIWTGYKSKWFWDSKPDTSEWRVNEYGKKIVIVPEKTVYKDLYRIED